MATRIAIGYTIDNPSASKRSLICAAYVHWGDSPDRMLPRLRNWFDTRDKVKALVDGGSMSEIRTRKTWDSGNCLYDCEGNFLRDEQGFLRYENDRDPQPLYHSERGDWFAPVTDVRPPSQWGEIMDIEHIYVMVSSTQHWNHIAID